MIAVLEEIMRRTMRRQADSDEHLMSIFGIALGTHATSILELGVREGNTTLPLLLAAHLNGGSLVSVDCAGTHFSPPEPLRGHWRFVLDQSLSFLGQCRAESKHFDLILVDDCHAYPHVKKELQLISELVTLSSVILVHDLMAPYTHPHYTPPEQWQGEWENGGPFRAVSELDSGLWEWSTIPVSNGLTLLRKKR